MKIQKNRKVLLFIIIFVFLKIGYTQEVRFNGDYTSHKTSYHEVNNEENSFSDDAVNNIFIQMNGNNGVFAFQDEGLPQNTLSYKIDSFEGHINDGEKELYIYNCTSLHKEKAKSEKIILYLNNDGSLSIMISSLFSSQVFFDLKKK